MATLTLTILTVALWRIHSWPMSLEASFETKVVAEVQ